MPARKKRTRKIASSKAKKIPVAKKTASVSEPAPVSPVVSKNINRPVKKKGKDVKINIQKLSEGQLLDRKIFKHPTHRIAQSAALGIILGLIIGGGILAYSYFQGDSFTSSISDYNIIVPNAPEEAASEETETPPEIEVVIQQVEISNTPTGWLNARKGPGTNYEVVSRVKPGEVYELVSTDTKSGWYEIRLNSEETAWVINIYSAIR